ncbi:MAG: methyltransferase domain-containing protein [Thiotrichales bacterium]|nr:methyltransferase domain-containing protein [Thiotrichales bacterium]
MKNHFDDIAEDYNDIWAFTPGYQEFMRNAILEALVLQPNDQLVDVGGGTGSYTYLISQQAGLLNKPYCVEPSAPMAAVAAQNRQLKVCCEDANQFALRDIRYDKLLLKEVVHHIKDRPAVWQGVFKQLNDVGRMLIVTRPRKLNFPFFDAAKQAFYHNQADANIWADELSLAGFNVDIQYATYEFELDKPVWFNMLRNRFMSDLAPFSDADIEAGILQVDRQYPKRSTVPVVEQLVLIVADKK